MQANSNQRNTHKLQKVTTKKHSAVSERSDLEKIWENKDVCDWKIRYPHISLIGRGTIEERGKITIYLNLNINISDLWVYMCI